MLQRLLGYSATDAGLVAMPRGFGTLIGIQLAGFLIRYIDGRWIVGCGLVLLALGLHMMSGSNLELNRSPSLMSGGIQGMGFGLRFMWTPIKIGREWWWERVGKTV